MAVQYPHPRTTPTAPRVAPAGRSLGGLPEDGKRVAPVLLRHEELGMLLLNCVAEDMKMTLFRNGSADLHGAAGRVLKLMREGRLGQLCFDLHD